MITIDAKAGIGHAAAGNEIEGTYCIQMSAILLQNPLQYR